MAVDTTVQVTLPQMGESVTEGTVLEWRKQEGDRVDVDEVLVEVSTDKVDAEVPAPTSGTVTKIHVAEGDTVQVGGVLAEIATGNGAGPAAAEGNGGAAAPAGVQASRNRPSKRGTVRTKGRSDLTVNTPTVVKTPSASGAFCSSTRAVAPAGSVRSWP